MAKTNPSAVAMSQQKFAKNLTSGAKIRDAFPVDGAVIMMTIVAIIRMKQNVSIFIEIAQNLKDHGKTFINKTGLQTVQKPVEREVGFFEDIKRGKLSYKNVPIDLNKKLDKDTLMYFFLTSSNLAQCCCCFHTFPLILDSESPFFLLNIFLNFFCP